MSKYEFVEDDPRENYSKILMQKSMFIHLPMANQKRDLNAVDLEEWRKRQLAEREKIRLAESTPEPPERPPKRPDLGLKSCKSVLFTPKPFVANNNFKDAPKKIKPIVPPKPTLTKETKTYLNCRRSSNSSLHPATISNLSPINETSLSLTAESGTTATSLHSFSHQNSCPEPVLTKSADHGDHVAIGTITDNHPDIVKTTLLSNNYRNDDTKTTLSGTPQRARLVRVDSQMSDYSVCEVDHQRNSTNLIQDDNQNVKRLNSYEERVKKEELEKMQQEKNVLITRIKSKLQIIREEKDLIKQELSQNDETVEQIIRNLEGLARIRDIDRIRRHSEEVSSLASLIQCLTYRLDKLKSDHDCGSPNRVTNPAHLTNSYNSLEECRSSLGSIHHDEKVAKLSSQLEDAYQLRKLSNMRRDNLRNLIKDLLDEETGSKFSFIMEEKTRLTLELREIEDKMKSGEEHLQNLIQIEYNTSL